MSDLPVTIYLCVNIFTGKQDKNTDKINKKNSLLCTRQEVKGRNIWKKK